MELPSGWWYWCSVGIGYDWKVRRRSGNPCRTGRRWNQLPVGMPGLVPFSSFSLPQPAVWVTVQSWTGLSVQSTSKPSGVRLQVPALWGRYPWPSSPFWRHLYIAVGVCLSGVCLVPAHRRGNPWGSCRRPCVSHAPANACVSASAVCTCWGL